MSDLKYWIGLSMLPDVGPIGARKLLSVFGSPRKVFSAHLNELLATDGIGITRAKNIRRFSLWDDIERQIHLMGNNGIKTVSFQDLSYPEMLRETDDAPVVIYMKGDIQPHDKFAIAVVGSRRLTHYGASVAEAISGELASMGFTIVSGMARGVDSLSHKAALEAGGRTVAVLGPVLTSHILPRTRR